MVASCSGYHKIVTIVCEIRLDRSDQRLLRVEEINSDNPAVGAGYLVHESAWLSEMDVLCLLSHDGKLGC